MFGNFNAQIENDVSFNGEGTMFHKLLQLFEILGTESTREYEYTNDYAPSCAINGEGNVGEN